MRTFMKILATSLVSFTVVSAANAADVYNGKMETPQGTISYDNDAPWNGAWIGVHGGWTSNDFGRDVVIEDTNGTSIVPDVLLIHESYSSDDWLFGAQFGVQKQFGSVVLGVEVDGSWLDTSAGVAKSYTQTGDQDVLTLKHDTSVDWLATARARVGLPINERIMPYVTGGVAFAGVSESFSASVVGDPNDNPIEVFSAKGSMPDDIRFGWVYGGGFDTKLGGGYSVGAEYLHVDLNDSKIRAAIEGAESGSANAKLEMDIIRAKLNYKF